MALMVLAGFVVIASMIHLGKAEVPLAAEPTLFEQVKDPQPRGLHFCLVRSDDQISWSRPMSVHEQGTQG